MNGQAGTGLLWATLGGILMGSFSLPMKKTVHWSWEATWLVWALAALVVTPWLIASLTVPDLLGVYARSGTASLAMVLLFGAGWGLGSVTFGQSISLLGMSLSFAISIGLTLALGALVPMAAAPRVFLTTGGIIITVGILLMLIGVVVSAVAGRLKEAQTAGHPAQGTSLSAGAFAKGLGLCILSGVFNPMLNFAFHFAAGIKQAALGAGASAGGASDAVWVIALLGGFMTNCAYCSILLGRRGTWRDYRKAGTLSHWFLAVLMGVAWVVSIVMYGRAAVMLGRLGASAGWAITMGSCIGASNVWGIVTGEWEDARGRPLRTMVAGLAITLSAIAVIGYGNVLAGE